MAQGLIDPVNPAPKTSFRLMFACVWLASVPAAAWCGQGKYYVTFTGPALQSGLIVPVEINLPPGQEVRSLSTMRLLEPYGPGSSDLSLQAVGGKLVCLVSDRLPPGRVPLAPGRRGRRGAFEFIDRDSTMLELMEDGSPVLAYNYGDLLVPGVPEDRRRSSYIHPVLGLDGERLTADFPADHPHHRGLFWAWPRVTVAGETYDLWHLRGVRHRFEGWGAREVGPVCALFTVNNGWYLGTDRKIVDEQVTVVAYRAGAIGRIIDLNLRLEATAEIVAISGQKDRGYGGLSLRPGESRDEVITTANGGQDRDSDLVPSPWGDFSARFDRMDTLSGVAIFQQADNSLFPSGWCLRHYGFLGVDFPGTEPVELRPGRPVELRYRVWVHRGDVAVGRVAEMYKLFARPPSGRLNVVAPDQ